MRSVAVFCGSSSGIDPDYYDCAFQLGQRLAAAQITLVYGGAAIGLMGAVADGALSGNGEVIGVLPEFLGSKEIAHSGLSMLIRTTSMHERKLKMHELSEAVITLPGGFGTLDEYFEMLTWAQLGLHSKPIGLLNLKGFYDGLLALADTMVESGLLKQSNRDMMISAGSIPELFDKMLAYQPSRETKWLKLSQS